MTKEEYSKKRDELKAKLEELTTLYKNQLQKMEKKISDLISDFI